MFSSRTAVFAVAAALLLLTGGAGAQVMRDADDPLDAFAIVDPRLRPSAYSAMQGSIESASTGLEAGVRSGWEGFLRGTKDPWKGYLDRRTGRVDSAEGAGIPWIPGAGNSLTAPESSGTADLQDLEATARAFLSRASRMLGVDPAALVLSPQRSGQVAPHLWIVDFDVQREGTAVEGARVVFRVNNGNMIQFGTENLPSPGAPTPPQKLVREEALAILAAHVGGLSAADTFVDRGTVRLLPAADRQGAGRGLVRVWDFTFRRRGSNGTWRARIDATTGEVLEFLDINRYAQVSGGVYPQSYIFNDEVVRPMPFADLSSGGFTSSSGLFINPGSASSTLTGKYVDINDQCGAISQGSGSFGHIAFGTSAGTDCATPGSGGAGNTHSARTQFYHVNRIKEVGRGWLPSNPWLNAQLPVNVNLNLTCNAFWNGSTINFYRSGGGCGNTGEIAAVSLHEYGHGLDEFDGAGFSNDMGTGEAYADVTAALMLHESCMGPGFRTTNCTGFGDACTACTGVRDIDWAKHVSNTPHTVENFTRLRCGSGAGYDGPCGRQGHCESHVASEAVWDLIARDLPDPGSTAVWMTTERLWYLSRPTTTSAFTCNTGSIPWTSNGCSAGSWWRTMRAADDDDGNLANGTPHSCHLFAAFNRHGIACASDPGANVCFSGCTPPAQSTLALTPGNRQVALSWTSSGPGVTYDVLRSENGCGAGFVKIADGVAAADFNDLTVANNLTYSYRVVAHAAGNGACAAPPTECQSAMPQEPPCVTPPPAPTGVAAAAQGIDRINITWDAVPGAVEYHVYRSATSGGPWTLVRGVIAPAAGYLDTGLEAGTAYFYVVRAASGESCVSGESAEASATTAPCQTATLYQNGFETGAGLADWTVAELSFPGSSQSWRGIQTCPAHGGSRIFRFGGAGCSDAYTPNQRGAARPQGVAGFVVPSGAAKSKLSFWHRIDFETGYDGGTLKISVDGGSYVQVPAAALSGATYNGAIAVDCQPPGTAGTPTFTGGNPGFLQTHVDLDAACNIALGGSGGCEGRTVRIGFEAINDCIIHGLGWFLDDVSVSTCVAQDDGPAPPLDFHTVAPCRAVDTRTTHAPALQPLGVRTFQVAGLCGVPAGTRSVSVNITAVEPGAPGDLNLFRADQVAPLTSGISFRAGASRGNNGLVSLSPDGEISVKATTALPLHFVLDVNGYFAE
ncbi:MAG TPA: hypothetical protein VN493_10115 [Thermoanaerobaculia bacterium]|nr:hypothetical protein [Thermoanaerobaculia bacterium]